MMGYESWDLETYQSLSYFLLHFGALPPLCNSRFKY